MKPISSELSRAISKDFEEISTEEHNDSEMYLADIAEVLIGYGPITKERVSIILIIIRKYGELKRREGETAATLKIVDAACGRLPV